MAKPPFTYTTSISIGGDVPTWEGEITFGYDVQPGEPETGPTYSCGGTPASYPCVIDVEVLEINGQSKPWNDTFNTDAGLEARFLDYTDDLEDEMLQSAVETLEARECA